jgi:6-phosphogluconolactonase
MFHLARYIFTAFLFVCQFILPAAHAQQKQDFHLLIGTYTRGKSEGIYVYSFNTNTGKATYNRTIKGVNNPSYLAVSPDRKFVYSVTGDAQDPGSVSAFSFNAKTGGLEFLNKQTSGSSGPCYVSVDATGKYVFAGNYSGGTVAALAVQPDGSLATAQHIEHKGSSIDKKRQDRPHVHATVLTPDNRFLMVPDLGLDKVMIYKLDPSDKKEPLTPASSPFATVTPGGGPRHLDFHPNGKYAYVVQEMGGAVTAFSYAKGNLEPLQTITMLDSTNKSAAWAADIHVSPDGKFLYASNRDEANEIVYYAINPRNGMLTYAGRQSTLGKTPRNFVIDPSGNFLLAANEKSDDIFIFRRDLKTGALTFTGDKIEIGAPVCLKFTQKD